MKVEKEYKRIMGRELQRKNIYGEWIDCDAVTEYRMKSDDYKTDEELKVQYKHKDLSKWKDLIMPEYVFRIKPKTKTIRFRNYMCGGNIIGVAVDDGKTVYSLYDWIGEWQEIEIEA